ncbi:MAG: excinuclease ABC subunit UvrA, partial [Planctomycetales bacterium]
MLRQGFIRARADGTIVRLTEDPHFDRRMRHNVEVVVDRLSIGPDVRPRLAEAVELALRIGEGDLIIVVEDKSGEPSEELPLSSRYCCVPCGKSYEPPSPRLFSFNSPQGMCMECHGLGRVHAFDPDLLVNQPELSFKQGCMELLGAWKKMGRWRRHVYQGVADTLEQKLGLESGAVLETPWQDLPADLQETLLRGAGDLHVTYAWRSRNRVEKYGGKFEGIIPGLTSKYRNARNRMYRRRMERFMSNRDCVGCEGRRLNPQAGNVFLATKHPDFQDRPERSLPEICSLSIRDAAEFFTELQLTETQRIIAEEAIKEIRGRLGFLLNVGLDYLMLDRAAPTLSGGESQRIRLASQVGCGLVGVTYVLDEPSIGLHPRDNNRLLETLSQLCDMGNTVVVVEHDEDTMRAADRFIDFGPGPGVRGGEVVAEGTLRQIQRNRKSLTGQFLSGAREIAVPKKRRKPTKKRLTIRGATHNNLKDVDVEIPLGTMVCVSGVSGSGKSSLIVDVLGQALRRDLNGAEGTPGAHRRIDGIKHADKLIAIDQSPIGRTPRSNPATYIKVFDDIRNLYAKLPVAKTRGYLPGRFSFNVAGGRCEACEGNGSNRLEMDFLADVWVTCSVCAGRRFSRETMQVRFKDQSISDVLEMDVQQALELFENITPVASKLQTLHDVGLDYLKLGQPSPTLSGGEAQRIKLARELVKRGTGRTIYLLDEPTTGLHFADVEKLLEVLQGFVDAGNTVIVIEHNLDVMKTADWIIDLGPEGGAGGGYVVAEGPPEKVAAVAASETGKALAEVLGTKRKPASGKNGAASRKRSGRGKAIKSISVRGAAQHNLKGVDVDIPRDRMTVCCGLSGSGKSSLAMDTIYAEGQRRYIESLSAYARQFVSQMQKPKLEHISGLSPAIAIEQKNLANTPRSTVGTVTEIYDYLRVLFARMGTSYCPDCDVPVGTQTTDQIVDQVMALPEGTKLYLMAPVQISVGEQYETLWEELRRDGYQRVRVDGRTHPLDNPPQIDRRRQHAVEAVIDRVSIREKSRSRIADSIENALSLGEGVLRAAFVDDAKTEKKWRTETYSQHLACRECGRSFEPLSPHNFSFNSSLGWCSACEGLGTQTGANPAALLRDPKLTLEQGAVALWPSVSQPLFRAMLAALSAHTGIPADVPFHSLAGKQRRLIMHGTGEEWVEVFPSGRRTKKTKPLLKFQYKGLYPSLE